MSLQSLIIIITKKLSEDFCFIFNNIINQIEYIKCNFFYFMFAIKSTNKKLYRGNKYILIEFLKNYVILDHYFRKAYNNNRRKNEPAFLNRVNPNRTY